MKYLILICLFTLASCSPFQKEPGPNEAEMLIAREWLYAFKVSDLINGSEVITRPPGIEQLVFSLLIPSDDGLSWKTHCVYYRVPYKQISGQLVVTEHKKTQPCPTMHDEAPFLEFNGLSDLSLRLENFKLSMTFKLKDKKIVWDFLLPNVDGGEIHEKYQPLTEKKLYPGLKLLRLSEESFDSVKNNSLGKLSDRLSRGSAIRCMQVDKNCKLVGENRCDDCRYGWFEVVDYNCPQGGSRFCGQNHCGEKNEPACVRGTKVVDEEDAGICQSDLTAVMNADHILVCQ